MTRLLPLVLVLCSVPGLLAGQDDTTFPGSRLHLRTAPLLLTPPPALRASWLGAPRVTPAAAIQQWDSSLAVLLDSARSERARSTRLQSIYGAKATPVLASDSASVRHGVLGLNPKYVDLAIDGQGRVEIRTERVRNERCTTAQLLDINSGCRGGFKAPRLDDEFAVRAGGLIGRRLHVNVDYDTQRDFSGKNNVQIYYQGLEDEIVRRVEVGSVVFRPPPSRFLTASIPANNFGVNAQFEVGALQLQTIAATQKGSVIALRNFTIGQTTSTPQDRQVRDLDFESGRFFWIVDPATLPGYPALDILNLDQVAASLPANRKPGSLVQVYRYRPSSNTGVNPNLGGVTAVARRSDSQQRVQVTSSWELLQPGQDYYVDRSSLWFVLAGKLDQGDYLAVSYITEAGDTVGTFPLRDNPAGKDSLELIVEPRRDATFPTFRYEMRQIYRVAGGDLDRGSLVVNLSANRTERPLQGAATYLAQLGLAIPTDPATFDTPNRLFPRPADGVMPTQVIKEAYIVFPHLTPFNDPTRLTAAERSDSLYRTPLYLLLSQGPPARFLFRLRYNSSGGGDRSTLDLNALQIREGSEQLSVGGRVLARGVDYNISYDLGQVTFLNPNDLFGSSGTAQVSARFEERGIFAVAPTQIFGFASRYSLGRDNAINLIGVLQKEQTAFNRPPLGFEASADMVGGVSTEFHFTPGGITRFFNHLTSTPASAPSRLDLNGEFALTRPDPNRSGEAFLEEFEGDNGVPISLREGVWANGSRPQRADSLFSVVGAQFDSADAVQLTWQNLVPAPGGGAVQLTAQAIDPTIRTSGASNVTETVMFMELHADTAGGIVQQNNHSRWSLPARSHNPRWRAITTSLSTTGVDFSRNEFLEFWVFQDSSRKADKAGVRLVFDLGSVSEDALAIAPQYFRYLGPDTTYYGRQYVGAGRLDTEREVSGVFNAETDDIGILGDRPDSLIDSTGNTVVQRPALCARVLSSSVPVFPWGDLSSRCTNGNGVLDTEDLNGDNNLDIGGKADNVFRWVVDLQNLNRYFVRYGVRTADSVGGWRLYRIPLRAPDVVIGSPNIRLVQHLRLTVAAPEDGGVPDIPAPFALARMRLLGAPWSRRSETPIAGISGATGGFSGAVVASIISTENTELGYQSPPGVTNATSVAGGSQSELGTVINEKSLRIIGQGLQVGQRAEAYLRFPAGPQNLLKYGELRYWVRGNGLGWNEGDFQAFLKLGSDSRNFYLYIAPAHSGNSIAAWDEVRVDLQRWRTLRAQVESRWLQGLKPDTVARNACGFGSDTTAYVACQGPYLVHLADPGINPPNLAAVQEVAGGIFRVATATSAADGELWLDDIRLDQPVSKVGTALALDARLVASDVGDLSLSYIRQDGAFQQLNADPTFRTTGTFTLISNWRLDRFLPASLGLSVPVSVSYARTNQNPDLIQGTDLEGDALTGLRKPRSWSATYSIGLRRSRQGHGWVTRTLVDPLSLSATLTRGRDQSDLTRAASDAFAYNAGYSLLLLRRGPHLRLGGLVDKLPRFLRESDAGRGLRDNVVSFLPTNIRLNSGLTRTENSLTSFQVSVIRATDGQIQPVTSLLYLWRNGAGLSWQPFSVLNLTADLSSTRDLRHYADSTPLGRLAGQSRRSFLGADVGVERDRSLNTALAFNPKITFWLRPRFNTSSAFVLSRSLTSRAPIRIVGDTAGGFILPQTLNNSRSYELGASVDLGRALGRLVGDSSKTGRWTSRIRPFDISNMTQRTSSYDLAAFSPGLGYQLGFGGLDRFLTQAGERALGVSESRTTTLASGADLPGGVTFSFSYSRIRSSRLQQFAGGLVDIESLQREWPAGTLRWNHPVRRGAIALIGVGGTYRHREGSTSQPNGAAGTLASATSSSTLAPDFQLGFRNGVVVTGGYSRALQQSENNGNRTENRQNDFNASFNYQFRLPTSVSRLRKQVRSSLTVLASTGVTCLQRTNDPSCFVVSDIRRQELRGGFDTDVLNIMTGGLQFGYSLTDARQVNSRVSQIFVSLTFQLSLFSGDYR